MFVCKLRTPSCFQYEHFHVYLAYRGNVVTRQTFDRAPRITKPPTARISRGDNTVWCCQVETIFENQPDWALQWLLLLSVRAACLMHYTVGSAKLGGGGIVNPYVRIYDILLHLHPSSDNPSGDIKYTLYICTNTIAVMTLDCS